jgi:geranylgeranyl diphosphate synthase, type I
MMWKVAPLDIDDFHRRVGGCLDAFLAEQATVLADIGSDLVLLADAARDLLRSGKRLRAAFCYWGWRGAGGNDCDEVVAAASAFELFHAAALIHDDVMDGSDTRRGKPAIHRRFAARHSAAGWTGSADRFGQAAAILLGDMALAWSAELFAGCGMPQEAVARARPMFDLMQTQLMAGQYLDVLEQARSGGTVEAARRVILYKSAKYSVEHPLLVGGLLAGADDSVLACYSAYGLPLGEAFQLRDDILGVFGDPVQTGKPAGDDLREGKRTVLIAQAVAAASPQQRQVLDRLGDSALDDAAIRAMRTVIVETGALDVVESRITALVDEAAAGLAKANIAPQAKSVLGELIDAATARAA